MAYPWTLSLLISFLIGGYYWSCDRDPLSTRDPFLATFRGFSRCSQGSGSTWCLSHWRHPLSDSACSCLQADPACSQFKSCLDSVFIQDAASTTLSVRTCYDNALLLDAMLAESHPFDVWPVQVLVVVLEVFGLVKLLAKFNSTKSEKVDPDQAPDQEQVSDLVSVPAPIPELVPESDPVQVSTAEPVPEEHINDEEQAAHNPPIDKENVPPPNSKLVHPPVQSTVQSTDQSKSVLAPAPLPVNGTYSLKSQPPVTLAAPAAPLAPIPPLLSRASNFSQSARIGAGYKSRQASMTSSLFSMDASQEYTADHIRTTVSSLGIPTCDSDFQPYPAAFASANLWGVSAESPVKQKKLESAQTLADKIKESFKQTVLANQNSTSENNSGLEEFDEVPEKVLSPEEKLEMIDEETLRQIRFCDEDGKMYRRIFVENLGWVSAKRVKELAEEQGIVVSE